MMILKRLLNLQSWRAAIAIIMLSCCFTIAMSPDAGAQTTTKPQGTCTTDPQFQTDTSQPGVISSIVDEVTSILGDISRTLFVGIAQDEGFKTLIRALITLYIAIYGILFTFGMVQETLHGFGIRLIKIGILSLLISDNGWDFFNNHVVTFFNAGTDQIITKVVNIAAGISDINAPADPFTSLDAAFSKAISEKTIVTLLATIATLPYGPIFGLLLVLSLGSFIKSILMALWIYLMSLVLRTLLFGVAPIFLACLLFDRTRQLFEGWLNQIVNACLQPIFLFTFFAFFVALISACLDNILYVPVCWTEWSESLRGSPIAVHFWRHAIQNSSGVWETFGGVWDFGGAMNPDQTRVNNAPVFPIDIMTILVFLILAELAGRFNSIVLDIARDLSGASTSLASMQGVLGNFFSGGGEGGPGGRGFGGDMPGGIGTRGAIRGINASGTGSSEIVADARKKAGSELLGNR